VAIESGHLCATLREQGLDTATLKATHDSKVATDVKGMYKTAQLHKVCVALNIPVSRMVKAWGGDRMLGTPVNPKFTVKYGPKNARYIDNWAFTADGLSAILGAKVDANKARQAVTRVLGADVANQLYK